MNIFKTLWGFLWKKNVVTQNSIDQAVIDKIAQTLADLIKFDKILNGKIAWMDKYDKWLITQLLTAFVSIFWDKMKPQFRLAFDKFIYGLSIKNTAVASEAIAVMLNEHINVKWADESSEELFIRTQVSLLLQFLDKSLNNGNFIALHNTN